ncbi:MAG TPA: peroxiredoxin family protein [Planctomycetota bacterium]|jgi:peroxiredoxin|nr:peroxiredoxin family protein [Planctomycetota bacterium]
MNKAGRMGTLLGTLILLAGAVQDSSRGAGGTPVRVGQEVPDFELTDAAGKDWKLSELLAGGTKGPVVLFFYCTTCGPCRLEEADMEKFYRAFRSKAQIRAVVGSRGETAAQATQFNLKKGLSFPCVADKTGRAAGSFNARTTLTLIIDKDRVLRYRGPLVQDGQAFARRALEAVLAGQEVAEKEVEDKTS